MVTTIIYMYSHLFLDVFVCICFRSMAISGGWREITPV